MVTTCPAVGTSERDVVCEFALWSMRCVGSACHEMGACDIRSKWWQNARYHEQRSSHTGTRTRVAWVKATYPNHLDYMGARTTHQQTTTHTQHQHTQQHRQNKHHTADTQQANTQHRRSSTTATFTHKGTRHEGAPPLQLTSARRGWSMASPRPSSYYHPGTV